MTQKFRHLKAVFLAVLIVIGMGVHHSQANAETLTVAGGVFAVWTQNLNPCPA